MNKAEIASKFETAAWAAAWAVAGLGVGAMASGPMSAGALFASAAASFALSLILDRQKSKQKTVGGMSDM